MHKLDKCLKIILFPPPLKLNIAGLYLHGDAAVWWDKVRLSHEPDELTYADFIFAFSQKYFSREAFHQEKNAFEHLRQDTKTLREYELKFNRLRRFTDNNMDKEDLIRRFLDGLWIDFHGICNVVTYTSLKDLVEKTIVQETCMVENQKIFTAVEPKSRKTSESHKTT